MMTKHTGSDVSTHISEKGVSLMSSMSTKAKKLIYWIGYLLLAAMGLWLSATRILPICNTTIFLFGTYWLWNAITLYLRWNPVFAAKDPRRAQLGYAAASAGLGIAWIIISFFALSNEALPMLLVSLPFVVWMGWLRAKQK